MNVLPTNLANLQAGEDALRLKAEVAIAASTDLLHLSVVVAAMDIADTLRVFGSEDDDAKTIQLLGIRIFNSFASAFKVALGGYSQVSALILRDTLETVFLVDRFRRESAAIGRWRSGHNWREFRPSSVRNFLDDADGFTTKKRAELYNLFSRLAGHPSAPGFAMLRPNGQDAHLGPFIDVSVLDAVISEMGQLGMQAGELLDHFIVSNDPTALECRLHFLTVKKAWLDRFYPHALP